jgi:hypothetical protein
MIRKIGDIGWVVSVFLLGRDDVRKGTPSERNRSPVCRRARKAKLKF